MAAKKAKKAKPAKKPNPGFEFIIAALNLAAIALRARLRRRFTSGAF